MDQVKWRSRQQTLKCVVFKVFFIYKNGATTVVNEEVCVCVCRDSVARSKTITFKVVIHNFLFFYVCIFSSHKWHFLCLCCPSGSHLFLTSSLHISFFGLWWIFQRNQALKKSEPVHVSNGVLKNFCRHLHPHLVCLLDGREWVC